MTKDLISDPVSLPSPALAITCRPFLEQGAAVMTAMALGLPMTGCARNDAIGRRQLILVDEDEVERMAELLERDQDILQAMSRRRRWAGH